MFRETGISLHKIFIITHEQKNRARTFRRLHDFVVSFHLSSPSGMRGNAMCNKETTFALACFVWLRDWSKRIGETGGGGGGGGGRAETGWVIRF